MKLARCFKLVSTFYSILTMGGGATAGYGLWSQMNSKVSDIAKDIGDATLKAVLSAGAPALIAVGCVLAVMGVIGFLGTLKKKSWVLLVFFVVVLIIFLLHITASIYLVLPKDVKEKSLSGLGTKFTAKLKDHYSPGNIYDQVMMQMKCCGYKGYQDFNKSSFVEKNNFFPGQCCGVYSKTDINCTTQVAEEKKVRGCIHVLLNENTAITGPLSFLIGILEIVALVVSLNVYLCLKRLPADRGIPLNPLQSS